MRLPTRGFDHMNYTEVVLGRIGINAVDFVNGCGESLESVINEGSGMHVVFLLEPT